MEITYQSVLDAIDSASDSKTNFIRSTAIYAIDRSAESLKRDGVQNEIKPDRRNFE